jgi:DNA gyrase subunit B
LNVERARLDKMVANEEIKSIVIALGTSIGETFDLSKIRYHKIVIATDADVDGAHIRTLLLTLFYRYLRPVIDAGYLYIAQPPLYKIKKGKDIRYAYSDEEKDAVKKIMGGDAVEIIEVPSDEPEPEEDEDDPKVKSKRAVRIDVQRYKGLGEMNAEELWETTMDPVRRTLKQVGVDDAIEADKTFDMLMGTDVSLRKTFIQANAKTVELDF